MPVTIWLRNEPFAFCRCSIEHIWKRRIGQRSVMFCCINSSGSNNGISNANLSSVVDKTNRSSMVAHFILGSGLKIEKVKKSRKKTDLFYFNSSWSNQGQSFLISSRQITSDYTKKKNNLKYLFADLYICYAIKCTSASDDLSLLAYLISYYRVCPLATPCMTVWGYAILFSLLHH